MGDAEARVRRILNKYVVESELTLPDGCHATRTAVSRYNVAGHAAVVVDGSSVVDKRQRIVARVLCVGDADVSQ